MWREKISVLLVIGCRMANYSFKGIQFNHTGEEKYKEKSSGHDDYKDTDRFRDVLHWHGMGLNVA